MLPEERLALKTLQERRKQQLINLTGGAASNHFTWYMDQVRIQIAQAEGEGFLTVAVMVFNKSLWDIQVKDANVTVELGGDALVLAPRRTSQNSLLGASETSQLTWMQPIQPETKLRLLQAIKDFKKISWSVKVEIQGEIGEKRAPVPITLEARIFTVIPFLS